MQNNNIERAVEYYTLVGKKNVDAIGAYLHPDVEFTGPLATLKGRDAVVQATRNFAQAFTSQTIRGHFGAGNQAMVVYDSDIPGISSCFPGASLMTFSEGLIVRIELFYDGSLFREKSKQIFK